MCASKPVPDGTSCPAGACLKGECVDCVRDSDCGSGAPHCVDNTCVACATDDDCAASGECKVGACNGGKCATEYAERGTPCATGVCSGLGAFSTCVACVDDSHCPGQVCSGLSQCVDCVRDDQCEGKDVCSLGGVCMAPPASCGNGVVEGTEECDPGKGSGVGTFKCSGMCKRRDLFSACNNMNGPCGSAGSTGICYGGVCQLSGSCPSDIPDYDFLELSGSGDTGCFIKCSRDATPSGCPTHAPDCEPLNSDVPGVCFRL